MLGAMVLSAIRAVLGYGADADPSCADCELRCASASVTPHEVHVLVRLPRDPGATGTTWWPDILGDRLAAFEAILDKKKIKATAFEYPDDRAFQHEAFVFSRTRRINADNAHLVATNEGDLVEMVRRAILDEVPGDSDESTSSPMTFIVCAHQARDARCGKRGPSIARALKTHSGQSTVLLSSHVGGHVYAGNVILYGGNGSGTWFGGINEVLVPKLLEGLREAEEKKLDPAACESLRPYWRGTSGRTKDEQSSFFAELGGGDIEDLG